MNLPFWQKHAYRYAILTCGLFVLLTVIAGCSESSTAVHATLPAVPQINPTSTTTEIVITPTVQRSTKAIATPRATNNCPSSINQPVPDFSAPDYLALTFKDNEQKLLEYLSAGGNPESLITNTEWFNRNINDFQIVDITGDGVRDIIFSPAETFVFSCNNGKYKIILKVEKESVAINSEPNHIIALEDMNLDGMPELVIASYGGNYVRDLDGWIYEWNGEQFEIKLNLQVGGRQVTGEIPTLIVKNANDDNFLELLAIGGIPLGTGEYTYYHPWRQTTDLYVWNGVEFILDSTTFSNPQYRYQVVQDADRAALKGNYQEAISQYQNAIYGDYEWYSAERKQFIVDSHSGKSNLVQPKPDDSEQPNLSGYSFFRMMVTYTLQGDLQEAQTTHDRIHKLFAKGFPGYDYVLIADAFWYEYQTNKDIETSCQKAIEYVTDHPAILEYLGSEHHNILQDIIYTPQDTCPFQ